MSEPAPHSKINLHALRRRAIPGYVPHRLTLKAAAVLALIDAVEAAEHLRLMLSVSGEPRVRDVVALREALARFDFEPPT